ncbi:MAG: Gfo/Idh/MocA family oxidoreductase [Bacteroidales bacterium]|nr:Gfo/Idh/MocA family oxidoreductase [Bacteroidales bacterium]
MKQQIRTGLCSFGLSGKIFHVPFLQSNPGFKITKVLERTKENSKTILPEAKIAKDFKELLDDQDLDLLIVNTPNHLHYPMAKEALLSGKHVLVEKPFTVLVEEGKELITLANDKKLVLTVYQNRRLDSDFKTVKKILSENILGKVKLFESQIFRWKPDLGNKLWKINANKGAGLLYDLGSHLIDQALVLFGMPNSLFADLRKLRKGAEVDDYFELQLFYNEFKVTLKSSLLASDPGHRFIIQGDKACYTKFGNDPQEEDLMGGAIPSTKNWGMEDEFLWGIVHAEQDSFSYPSLNGSYPEFFENLYHAIVDREPLIVKPEEALDVIRIIELANISFSEKRMVEV